MRVAGSAILRTHLAAAAAVGLTAIWSGVATSAIVKGFRLFSGLRGSPEEEYEGLDFSAHGERAYDFN